VKVWFCIFIPWLLDVGLRLHHRHGLVHDETLADFHHIPVELERVGQDTRVGGLDILTEEGGDRTGQQLSVEESVFTSTEAMLSLHTSDFHVY